MWRRTQRVNYRWQWNQYRVRLLFHFHFLLIWLPHVSIKVHRNIRWPILAMKKSQRARIHPPIHIDTHTHTHTHTHTFSPKGLSFILFSISIEWERHTSTPNVQILFIFLFFFKSFYLIFSSISPISLFSVWRALARIHFLGEIPWFHDH